MVDKVPTKVEIFNAVDALGKTIENLSERIVAIETKIERQDDRNRNVIIAVLIAAVLIVATVAVEVIITQNSDNQRLEKYLTSKSEQDIKISELLSKIDLLKARNTFLK